MGSHVWRQLPESPAKGPFLTAEPAPRNRQGPRIGCVFLTPSIASFEEAWHLLEPADIRLHPAATLDQARAQLLATDARVLLAEVMSTGTALERTAEILDRLPRGRALIFAGPLVDERFWVAALQRGASDVVQSPFDARELCRVIANADAEARHRVISGRARKR